MAINVIRLEIAAAQRSKTELEEQLANIESKILQITD